MASLTLTPFTKTILSSFVKITAGSPLGVVCFLTLWRTWAGEEGGSRERDPAELGWERSLCQGDALVSLVSRKWVILGTLTGARSTLSVLGWGLPCCVVSVKWPLAVLDALDMLRGGAWDTRACKLLSLRGRVDDPGSCQVTGGLYIASVVIARRVLMWSGFWQCWSP